MSTFCGRLDEFPHMAVDNFTAENREARVFFLSHCHADHMMGLSDRKALPGPLYTSVLSTVLLRSLCPHVQNVIELKIGVSTILEKQEPMTTVTAIPAGHCLGSVMFLFENCFKRVLYTGDFRLQLKDIATIRALHFNGQPIALDAIYFDSTFFLPSYAHFPSRTESIRQIGGLIKDWLDQRHGNRVMIRQCARYGYETLLIDIADRLSTKIHVSDALADQYGYIPELDYKMTSACGSSLRIHACNGSPVCLPSSRNVLTIKPSAMLWTHWRPGDPVIRSENQVHRLCYATHCSFSELKDFLLYFKSPKLRPNVVPESIHGQRKLNKNLRDIQQKYEEAETALADTNLSLIETNG